MTDLPTGLAVERLANAMSAGVLGPFHDLDPDARDQVRRMAHCGLASLGVGPDVQGSGHLAGELIRLADLVRDASSYIDGDPDRSEEGERLAKALVQAGHTLDALQAVLALGGLPVPPDLRLVVDHDEEPI